MLKSSLRCQKMPNIDRLSLYIIIRLDRPPKALAKTVENKTPLLIGEKAP